VPLLGLLIFDFSVSEMAAWPLVITRLSARLDTTLGEDIALADVGALLRDALPLSLCLEEDMEDVGVLAIVVMRREVANGDHHWSQNLSNRTISTVYTQRTIL
jgi:hypothetical protein